MKDAVVLFAGMGGACQGIERAGVRVRLAVDGWDAACIAHRRWMPETPVVRARCEAAPVNSARPWIVTHKGDADCRALADAHYTRQMPGHPMWTRPGYNFVLRTPDGGAAWCWWRPKWEAGLERKDGLRAIECTMFRRKSGPLASHLVREAVLALSMPEARRELHHDDPLSSELITGIGTAQTASRRSAHKQPGVCFREVGWEPFDHRAGRADLWLRCTDEGKRDHRPWLLWASPSCKPWSTANRTLKRGKAHPEYYSTALLVRQQVTMGARWLVMENVGGLLWSREGRVELDEMRAEAQRLGLRWYASVVNSNTVGVAQIRRRLFIIVGPEYVKIPHGSDYIPPENAETPPMACEGSKGSWERETRWPKASRDFVRATGGWDDPGWPKRATQRSIVGPFGLSTDPRTLAVNAVGQVAARGVVDAARHANWTGAQRAVESGEHVGRLRTRDGIVQPVPHGRTLAECCALQQVPMEPLAGFSKRVAHELVGNAVPSLLAEHVVRTLLAADTSLG